MGSAARDPQYSRVKYEEFLPYVMRLPGAKGNSGGPVKARCPAHDDAHASLSLHPLYGITCFTGCAFGDIMQALGIEPRNPNETNDDHKVIPIHRGRPDMGEPSVTYDYRDEGGALVAVKGRWDLPNGKKTFQWRMPAGEWEVGLDGLQQRDLPLYGAELLVKSAANLTVYFTEGEKAAEACREHGLLTVTHGGGAAIRDFGDKLELLRGRKVVVLPDNDGPGRTFAAVLSRQLRSIATVRVVPMDVAEHGDAFDYFAAGGTVEDLERQTGRLLVEYLDTDSIRVTVPTGDGVAAFTFSDMTPRARGIEAEVSVSTLANEDSPYSVRIDLLSQSHQDALRRALDSLYGTEHVWTAAINTAINKARTGLSHANQAVMLADVEAPTSIPYLVQGIIPDRVVTIPFGDQESLKTYVAYEIALCVALGEPFLGQYECEQGGVLIVDWEMEKGYAARRFRRLLAGRGITEFPRNIHYYPAGGMSIRDVVREIRGLVQEHNIRLVIIDSVVPACGGDPMDPAVAVDFFKAVNKLGTAVIAISHITKSQSGKPADTTKPFSSAYWSYEARCTIYVERSRQSELTNPDRVSVILHTRKMGEAPKPHPLGMQVDFDGTTGPVVFSTRSIDSMPPDVRVNGAGSLAERVWAILNLPRTRSEIAEMIGSSEDSIRKTLDGNPKKFQKVELGGGRGNKTVYQRGSKYAPALPEPDDEPTLDEPELSDETPLPF